MTPVGSWPRTVGSLRCTYQSVTSDAHTPQARTSHTTSPGPGVGSATSSMRTSSSETERATLIDSGDPLLGHERCHERRGRDVEGGIAARRAGEHLVGAAFFDRDLIAGGTSVIDGGGWTGDHERNAGRVCGECQPI